jgi:hypothetical protein
VSETPVAAPAERVTNRVTFSVTGVPADCQAVLDRIIAAVTAEDAAQLLEVGTTEESS